MVKGTVRVINHRARVPTDGVVIDTTSHSTNWSKGLSPFFLGPVELYDDYEAKTFENGYQYCKVYQQHTDADGNPTPEYFQWARKGWENPVAKRYPMGPAQRTGAIKPKYSLFDNRRMDYVTARKNIYCQLYSACVEVTPAYEQLVDTYNRCVDSGTTLYLRDYDGRDTSASYREIINDGSKKMGHAFVLAMLLENQREW